MITSITPPEILVKQCQKGDRRASRELYDRYAKAMYNICLRMLGDVQLAEDILQEAFIQVFGNIHNFRGESSPGAWIKRIVVNKCINQLKRKKIYWLDPEDVNSVAEEDGIDEKEFEWTVAKIKAAIMKLPDGYRTVLNLYLMENYSHREIAKMLDISESTAKTQYMRAKAKVRELVGSD